MAEILDHQNAVNDDGDVVPINDVYGIVDDEGETTPQFQTYWESCITICNLCGGYQRTKKLYSNFTHDDTRHRVQHVVNNPKYYGGSEAKVKSVREKRRQEILRAVEEYNVLCRECGIEELDPDTVIAELFDGAIIQRYRNCFRTRLKNDAEPFPFMELPERSFRRKH